MICCKDCKDIQVVCHHCKFWQKDYSCAKHKRDAYPSDCCNDYFCKHATLNDVVLAFSYTASTFLLEKGA